MPVLIDIAQGLLVVVALMGYSFLGGLFVPRADLFGRFVVGFIGANAVIFILWLLGQLV